MCRMFAVASKEKVNTAYLASFQRLAVESNVKGPLSDTHEDGWGIAGYLGNWTTHFGRSAGSAVADVDEYCAASEKAVNSGSKIIVSHLRQASEGNLSLVNAHPFIHYDWIFCHNGTVNNSERLLLANYKYEGTTDSERVFKYIIDRLYRRKLRDFRAIILDTVAEIKAHCPATSLTFILANRSYLIGFRDYSVDAHYYTLNYSYVFSSFMFCSEALAGRDWISMKNGELIIVEKTGSFIDPAVMDTEGRA